MRDIGAGGQSAVVTTWVVVWPGSCWLVSSGFGELGEYRADVVGMVCGAYDAVSMPSLGGVKVEMVAKPDAYA